MNRSASFLVALALAMIVVPASAQNRQQTQGIGNPPPATLLPPPPRYDGQQDKRDSSQDPNRLGRELEAASRRVQASGIRNEIRQRGVQLDADRARTDRLRAINPGSAESERLHRSYEQRHQDYERWRAEKERQREQIEPPIDSDGDR